MISISMCIWIGAHQKIVIAGEILDQNGIDAIFDQDGVPFLSQ